MNIGPETTVTMHSHFQVIAFYVSPHGGDIDAKRLLSVMAEQHLEENFTEHST